MSFKNSMEVGDYSTLYDYFSLIDEGDSISILLKENDKENMELIRSLLERKNFFVESCAEDKSKNYIIKAKRL